MGKHRANLLDEKQTTKKDATRSRGLYAALLLRGHAVGLSLGSPTILFHTNKLRQNRDRTCSPSISA
jgi:hypothetical protein